MRIRLIWCLLTVIIVDAGEIMGQQIEHKHHHHDHLYELGVSLGLVHLMEDDINTTSSHVHLFRRLGSENYLEKTAIGIGVEYVFTEHTHLSFLGTFSYNPVGGLIIEISPGILISEHENKKEIQYLSHIELTYEMDFKSFGFGPVVGVAFAEDDRHYTFGIHLGKGL